MNSFPVRLFQRTIFLAVAFITVAHAQDAVQVSGVIDGKPLQFALDVQRDLAEEAASLLAHCTNTVLQPHGTLASAKRKSHLQLVFPKPRSFDLGVERRFGTTNVLVKEIVIELPLSSGGAWIDSTLFHFYCSKYDAKAVEKMQKILESVQKPPQQSFSQDPLR